MKTASFQIVIPACDAVDEIDQTMKSIWQQHFDREQIYTIVVDFGSTDGTYQKLLRYDPFHLGIYQVNKDISESGRASESGRIASYIKPLGQNCCKILLRPGDIIYPDGLAQAAQVMERHPDANMIISESDVQREDGSVTRPRTLYDSERVIDGKAEYLEYLTRGYRHHVICFGGDISDGRCYINGQMNDNLWWNKNFFTNFRRDAVYIPEFLGRVRERFYEDELQEILLRWDNITRFHRFSNGQFELTPQEAKLVNENMSRYILWRSYLLAGKGDERQARECFLLSAVLYPEVRKMQIYQWMEKYVLEKEQSIFPQIQAFFQTDE